MIYLDSAATTPVRREVLEAMWPYLTGEFGNPSSSHGLGDRAANALKAARATVAEALHCRPSEVIFTSGGTEADNLAIKGIALAAPRGRHIVTTPIEHEAVLASCDYLERHHGFTITHVPVDRFGIVDPQAFAAALRDDTTLCSVMLANNEVGTIQPIAELAAAAHARNIPFHTDAVQAAGALALDVRPPNLPGAPSQTASPFEVGSKNLTRTSPGTALGVDALSISGHKLGAPKGVGALFLRGRLLAEPVLHGGGQERGRRSGTENVAGAIALAKALELATTGLAERSAKLTEVRDALIAGVLAAVPSAKLTGHPAHRLPGNASFCFPGTSGEAILLQLEERGIVCSSGSACAAGRNEPSHVLLAMGVAPDVARTAVRFTLSDAITLALVPEIVEAVGAACAAVGVPN